MLDKIAEDLWREAEGLDGYAVRRERSVGDAGCGQ